MADAPRRTFGPVVLLGLASAGLASVAGSRTWAEVDPGAFLVPGLVSGGGGTSAGDTPLAGALALVALAAWGVLLVTRGRARRAVAVLALLAAVGMVVTGVVGWSSSVEGLAEELDHMGAQGVSVNRTAWVWVYLGAAVSNVAASVLAVRFVPSWPEMGSRYDAPGAGAPPAAEGDKTGLDLWRALDDGRDPTLHERDRCDP
jgi:uncharacterized membrane protein (TIGR02234 family)